jgi:hypothetical protein
LEEKICSITPMTNTASFLLMCKVQNKYPFSIFNSIAIDYSKTKIVKLSNIEVAICRFVGPLRTQAARQQNMTNMIQLAQSGTDSEAFAEINGLCGELVLGKYLNLYPYESLEISPRSIENDAGDYVVNGTTIDVKTTEYSYGRLTLANWKVQKKENYIAKVQLLCLVTGDYRQSSNFIVQGFYPSRLLVAKENLKNLPGRTNKQYIVEQCQSPLS